MIDEQHREHVEISAGVEHDRLLDDAEADGGGGDAREVVHPAEHDGGQGPHEHGDAERAADREARARRRAGTR